MAGREISVRDMIEQGTLRFTVGYKVQTIWGIAEALVFALEGVGATLVAVAVWQEQTVVLAAGIALMAAAVVLLVGHLGQPRNVWKAMRNLRQSWVSRGTLLIGGLIAMGLLQLVVGWTALGSAAWVLKAALFLDALAILAYPGFVLSSSPAIPFWNSGLMPVLSFVSGAASGFAVWLAFAAVTGQQDLAQYAQVLLVALGVVAACVFAYVAVQWRGPAASGAAARRLLRREAGLFLGLACVVGLLVAALAAAPVAFGSPAVPAEWLIAAALARVPGDLALRQVFMRVGLYDPVL